MRKRAGNVATVRTCSCCGRTAAFRTLTTLRRMGWDFRWTAAKTIRYKCSACLKERAGDP